MLPWMMLVFFLGVLLLAGSVISRTLGLARGSRRSINLEETAINVGARLTFVVGLIWLLLWAWESVIPRFVENLPGG